MKDCVTDYTREKFVSAMRLISNEESWCQGAFAMDEFGVLLNENDPHACKWCSAGALFKDSVYNSLDHFNDFCNIEYSKSIIELNDTLTHKEVMSIWQDYINYCDQNNLWLK